jgi:transcriptional regulator GlxA family with amidase domain
MQIHIELKRQVRLSRRTMVGLCEGAFVGARVGAVEGKTVGGRVGVFVGT